MQRLTIWLFRRPEVLPAHPWKIFIWWEKRRLFFNLVVGATGIFTSAVFVAVWLATEKLSGDAFGLPDPPIFVFFVAFLYGVAANICYTVGPIAEIVALRGWKEKAGSFGEIAFFLGMVSSVLVTLIPGLLIVILATISLLARSRGH